MRSHLQIFADQLKNLLHGPEFLISKAALAQEALDLLAVAEGLKPLAVLCHPSTNRAWARALVPLLNNAPVESMFASYWVAEGEFDDCPKWYTKSVREHRQDQRLRVAYRPRSHSIISFTLAMRHDIPIIAEAKLLGYPLCCVRAHSVRTRLVHQITSTIIARTAGPDPVRMQQIVKSEIRVTPRCDEERRRLSSAASYVAAPYTSINMCGDCQADPSAPARRLSERYAELARETGLEQYFCDEQFRLAGE